MEFIEQKEMGFSEWIILCQNVFYRFFHDFAGSKYSKCGCLFHHRTCRLDAFAVHEYQSDLQTLVLLSKCFRNQLLSLHASVFCTCVNHHTLPYVKQKMVDYLQMFIDRLAVKGPACTSCFYLENTTGYCTPFPYMSIHFTLLWCDYEYDY